MERSGSTSHFLNVRQRLEERRELKLSAKEDKEQVREAMLELVRAKVEDIRSLRELAEQTALSADDILECPAGRRDAVGLAMYKGDHDIVVAQLTAWSIYFATMIDELFWAHSFIEEQGAFASEHNITQLHGMAQDILSALQQSVHERSAGVSA